jgi:serine/threonine protein kinase
MAYPQDIGIGQDISRFIEKISDGSTNIRIASGEPVSENSFKKYTLLGIIGIGGFGIVLKARSDAKSEDVAIKCCYNINDIVSDEEKAERYNRFKKEAELTKRAGDRSEYVVRVIDTGMIMNESGRIKVPCMVMDYVSDMNLQHVISMIPESLKPEDIDPLMKGIYAITRQTLLGLGDAFKIGILHRDMKPSNILIDKNQLKVKITDFGISYDKEQTTEMTVIKNVFKGTAEYASKYSYEQIYDVDESEIIRESGGKAFCMRDGKKVSVGFDKNNKPFRRFHGPQTDLMPVGSIILPEEFIKRNIYKGDNDEETRDNILHKIGYVNMDEYKGESATVRALKSKARKKLTDIINKGKADDIRDSYSCAEELLEDLDDFARLQFGGLKNKDEEASAIKGITTHILENGCREANDMLIQSYVSGNITKDIRNKDRIGLLSRYRPNEDNTQNRIKELFSYTEKKVKDTSTSDNEISCLVDMWKTLAKDIKPEQMPVIKKLIERSRIKSGGDTE